MRPFFGHLRRMGHVIICYLGDVGCSPRVGVANAIHASFEDEAVADLEVAALTRHLGMHLHPRKRDFTGSTRMELLGILVDTKAGLFLLSPETLLKVRASALAVQREIRRGTWCVSLRHMRSFADLAQSKALAVTDDRLHLRKIFNCVRDAERLRRRRARLTYAADCEIL